MGLFTNYGEIGPRSKTDWRALAVDAFLQDSWKGEQQPDARGRAPLRLLAALARAAQQRGLVQPAFYDPALAVDINRQTGAIIPNSGDPYNGVVLPGDGFPAEAEGQIQAAGNPDLDRLFRGVPRASRRRTPRCSSRAWARLPAQQQDGRAAGRRHLPHAHPLNDSTLLGGNPPIQFKVGVTNGVVDQPTGRPAPTSRW
jgi:hypothetical protein